MEYIPYGRQKVMLDTLKNNRKILDPENNWSFDFKVEARNVYGKELYYPANDRAQTFLKLTGKKTFDKTELKIVEQVGYNVIFTTKTMEDL
jgi:hypothetical protein|tara:strand:+ start:351 stop:623 length:273 start_codon:yes stop_codon:yes gene_type:complete